MISINQKLSSELIIAAHSFEKLRNNCKNYLSQFDLNFDKFTVLSHDSFIGYITEHFLQEYISTKYAAEGIEVNNWESMFDISRIRGILKTDSKGDADVQYVRSWFYDHWDLEIIKAGSILFIDVKTALTQKEPKLNWDFMYPMVQAHKPGKDYMILSYYVAENASEIESLKKLVIVGYTSEEVITTCKVIRAGTLTRFGTKSQIDNYETELAVHYESIDKLIAML